MPSTYTLNNGIELIATGEQSGTWGDTTNTNLSLVDTALDGQVTVTLTTAGTSGSPNTLAISDGAASDGRNRMVIFDDGGDLSATAYVQLTPNDAEKIIYIRNDLSGSRSIVLFQGTYSASNDYEVPAGTTAVVYFDGAGSGAVAANVFNNAYFDSLRLGSVSVTAILDEDDMSSDSPTSLATQQSIKAYVDSQVTAQDLDFAGDSGTGAVDLDSQTFTIAGTTNEIETSASNQTLTIGLPDDVTIAGDLTVDTDTLYVDSTNDRVGVGTDSPSSQIHISSAAGATLRLTRDDTTIVADNIYGNILFTGNDESAGASGTRANILVLGEGTNGEAAITFKTAGSGSTPSEAMRIDSSRRVLIGGLGASLEVNNDDAGLQLTHSGELSYFSQARFRNNTASARHYFSKSRNTVTGTYGVIVQDGDSAGQIIWTADDGVDGNSQVAAIDASVDGTPGANDMPGRIVFSTTSDGANAVTERMRIDNAGRVGIGTSAISGYNAYGDGLVVKKSSIAASSGITIQAPQNTGYSSLYFGDPDDTKVGWAEYSHSADSLTFGSGNGVTMVLDSSQRVLMGLSSSISGYSVQTARTDGTVGFSALRYSADAYGAYMVMSKSRNASIGGNTSVQSGDALGYINWAGNDGTDMNSLAAGIWGEVDGTPGSNDMPGRLVFKTTADGSSSSTERMRINNSGDVGIGGARDPDTPLHIYTAISGAITPLLKLQANVATNDSSEGASIDFVTSGDNTAVGSRIIGTRAASGANMDLRFHTARDNFAMLIDTSQRVLIGTTFSGNSITPMNLKLSTDGGSGNNLVIGKHVAGAYAPAIAFAASDGTEQSPTAVAGDDPLGQINFYGYDGNSYALGGYVAGLVDGAVSDGDMPMRLAFFTSADGTESPTERMRISNDGRVSIGFTGVKSSKLLVVTSDGQKPTNASSARPALLLTSSQTAAVDVGPSLYFRGKTGNTTAEYSFAAIHGVKGSATADDYSGHLVFYTQPSGGATLLAEAMRIDNNGRVSIGSDTLYPYYNNNTVKPHLQVTAANGTGYTIVAAAAFSSTDGNYPQFTTGKSASNTVGTHSLVANGEGLGLYGAQGSDGTQFVEAASMRIEADGSPGADDMPGRIRFLTTADGAASGTERMRIDSAGDIYFYGSDGSAVVGFDRSADDFAVYKLGTFTHTTARYSVRTSGNAAYSIRLGTVSGTGSRVRIKLLGSIGYGSPSMGEVIIDCGVGNDDDEFKTNVTANGSFSTIHTDGGVRVYTDRNNGTSYDVWLYVGTYARFAYHVEDAFGWTPHFDNASGTGASIPATAVQTEYSSSGRSQQDELIFIQANNTEIARLNSTGLVFPNGNGIDFSASEGSGASSSVLDDYEEGTWTPTFVASTMGTSLTYSNATYVKIGKVVHLQAVITMSGTSGNVVVADYFRIGGLPYSIENTSHGVWWQSTSYATGVRNSGHCMTAPVNTLYGGCEYAGGVNRTAAISLSLSYEVT